jgi:hypothetical protein
MQITILKQDGPRTYEELPHGDYFLWCDDSGMEAKLFLKPSVDLQLNGSEIHAIQVENCGAVKFSSPEKRHFLPVVIDQITARIVSK